MTEEKKPILEIMSYKDTWSDDILSQPEKDFNDSIKRLDQIFREGEV